MYYSTQSTTAVQQGLTEVWTVGMQHHIEGDMALSKEWMASCIHCVRRAFIFTLAVLARDINS